jgi:H+/Cl- antiporter ClcA
MALLYPYGLFVPVVLTGAAYGRLIVGMLIGSQSTLDHGPFAVLGSAALLGGSMRMTVSVCVIVLEAWNCSDPLAPFFVYTRLPFLKIGVSVCTDLNWKS